MQFNDFLNTIFFSSPTVALIVAIFLDNTLDYKESARDRGMPWWVKFRTFKGDSRNEEFYTLPFNLNRFFPPSWSKMPLKKMKDVRGKASFPYKDCMMITITVKKSRETRIHMYHFHIRIVWWSQLQWRRVGKQGSICSELQRNEWMKSLLFLYPLFHWLYIYIYIWALPLNSVWFNIKFTSFFGLVLTFERFQESSLYIVRWKWSIQLNVHGGGIDTTTFN